MTFFQTSNDHITLNIMVQPRSSRNQVAGIHADALKIKLTAPPVDGEANKRLIKYLAKLLKLPKSSLTIIRGETSRTKCISISTKGTNRSISEITNKLQALTE